MVQAIINISEEANKVLNVVKAKYGLNDKSAAIDLMAKQYEESILEPQLKPSYVALASKIQQQKTLKVGTVNDLRKRYAK